MRYLVIDFYSKCYFVNVNREAEPFTNNFHYGPWFCEPRRFSNKINSNFHVSNARYKISSIIIQFTLRERFQCKVSEPIVYNLKGIRALLAEPCGAWRNPYSWTLILPTVMQKNLRGASLWPGTTWKFKFVSYYRRALPTSGKSRNKNQQ